MAEPGKTEKGEECQGGAITPHYPTTGLPSPHRRQGGDWRARRRQKCSAETEPQEVCVEEVYLIAYALFISVTESVIKSLC